jgi:Domain of unknown function (DUF4177)
MDERWEYKIIAVSADQGTSTGLPSNVNEECDKLGADGWELVATAAIIRPGWLPSAAKTVRIVCFFKRRLRG